MKTLCRVTINLPAQPPIAFSVRFDPELREYCTRRSDNFDADYFTDAYPDAVGTMQAMIKDLLVTPD